MDHSKPAAFVAALFLTSCAHHHEFSRDFTEQDIQCADKTVNLSSLYTTHKEVLLSFMRAEGTFDETISYEHPSITGYKYSGGQHLVEFDFADPNENSDYITLDGGVAVTLNACTGQPVSTSPIVSELGKSKWSG